MLRTLISAGVLGLSLCALTSATDARSGRAAPPKAASKDRGDDRTASTGKPVLLGNFEDWGAYRTQNDKGKICYALAKPKERQPSRLVRDPSYVLVSTRPGEHVRNEVSFIMGFPMKDGDIIRGADVNGAKFDLVAKGENAWVKDAAQEAKMVDIMRRGTRLTVKAASARGNTSTDVYMLGGVSDALDKVAKECR